MTDAPSQYTLSDRIRELDIPLELDEEIEELCSNVFGDDCGHLENVRLAWEVPPPDAGQDANREGWRIYECDVVGLKFSVPHGAPIPVILANYYNADNEYESILYRYVHPELIEHREELHDRLVSHIRDEIEKSLASLSTSYNLLKALQGKDEVPDGSSPSPYHPVSEDERVGYEPAEDERPIRPQSS